MSPTPARTSLPAIVAAAREMLEEEGPDGVTMAGVASRVGIRPPSLYKHVRDRTALMAAIATSAAGELGAELAVAADESDGTPQARLTALADAYRTFAHRSPRASALLFADPGSGAPPPVDVAARAAEPVIRVAASLVGPADALAAARVLTAFAYGFTSMEQAGAFRLGTGVDDAFRLGIEILARGLLATPTDQEPG